MSLETKFTISTYTGGSIPFKNPTGVCIDDKNRILVADSGNDNVKVFNYKEKYVRYVGSFGVSGTYTSQFKLPQCISLHGGNIMVSDQTRIQIFDDSFIFIKAIPIDNPLWMTSQKNGNIVVASLDDQIRIFDENGSIVQTFGSKRGSDYGEFDYPSCLCCDSSDRIIVCDTNNNRIQIFSPSGEFQYAFGGNGTGPGQFDYPRGVCVDKDDYIYVADSGNQRIQIFDKNGNFVAKFCFNDDIFTFKPTSLFIKDDKILIGFYYRDLVSLYVPTINVTDLATSGASKFKLLRSL